MEIFGERDVQTFLCFRGDRFAGESSFLERPPFEVLFVATAIHISSVTLLTRWFRLVAFQAFRFTRHAA